MLRAEKIKRRIEEDIKKKCCDIIFKKTDIHNIVVRQVILSDNLRYAKLYFSSIDVKKRMSEIEENKISRLLNRIFKGSPRIALKFDTSPNNAYNIISLIEKKHMKIDINEFKHHEQDCGSSEVQVALLTKKILHLADHAKAHKKDLHSYRGLMTAINKRKRLLNYIKITNFSSYKSVLSKLGLRK